MLINFLANTAPIDEVFNNRRNIDLNQIKNNYSHNYSSVPANSNNINILQPNYNPNQLDSLMNQQFNYELVNNAVDPNKMNSKKDSFSFVNDMLKPKKII